MELSWCQSWSNSLWQGWNCGLVYCPARNATDPIWRMLASSDGICSWTPLRPQRSHPNPIHNPNPLANQLWCIDFLTPPTPLHHPSQTPCLPWISYTTSKLMLDSCKMVQNSLKLFIRFCGIFQSLKQNFIAYRSSKVSDCVFEIHQQWQSGFSKVVPIPALHLNLKP